MKVSIITSLYNEVHNLPLLFNSIKRQTYKGFEVLITDDGSMDGTAEKLKDYCLSNPNIRIFSHPNKGLTYSLNHMIKEARGEYVARMDVGDFSYPERIQRQVEYLDQNLDAVVVGCWVKVKYKQWAFLDTRFPNDHIFLKNILMRTLNCFAHGSIMFRRNAANELSGPYRFPYSQDVDFLIRLSTKGKLAMIEKILYEYQISVDSVSFRRRKYQEQFAKLAVQNYMDKYNINAEPSIKRIMENTDILDDKTVLADFYMFIGNLLLRNYLPKKAKQYYIKSLKNGKRNCLPYIYLCNIGRFSSSLTNFVGNHIDSMWRYKVSCISEEFQDV